MIQLFHVKQLYLFSYFIKNENLNLVKSLHKRRSHRIFSAAHIAFKTRSAFKILKFPIMQNFTNLFYYKGVFAGVPAFLGYCLGVLTPFLIKISVRSKSEPGSIKLSVFCTFPPINLIAFFA